MPLCQKCAAIPFNGSRSAKHSELELDYEINTEVGAEEINQAHYHCRNCGTIWGWESDPIKGAPTWKFAETIRITHVRESNDGESVLFELIKGQTRKQALVSRTALLQFQGIQSPDLLTKFEANKTQIWQAGMAKWDREPESQIIRLSTLDF